MKRETFLITAFLGLLMTFSSSAIVFGETSSADSGQTTATRKALPKKVSSVSTKKPLSPEELENRLKLFDYQSSDFRLVERKKTKKRKLYDVETLTLSVNDPLGDKGEFKQIYKYYRVKGTTPMPVVLIFPPFIDRVIDDWAASLFAKGGYHALIVRPPESLTDPDRPLNKLDDMLIRYTIAVRMGIDVLESFPEVDRDRVYAYGISMGGIRTALAFGVEPRIKKAAEIVGGGDLPGVIADTNFGKLRRARDARMKAEGINTLDEFKAYLYKEMTVDPLDFACLRQPEDIMMVLGRGDKFVRDEYQSKLFYAFARPAEGRYPVYIQSKSGHVFTALGFFKYAKDFMEFFER